MSPARRAGAWRDCLKMNYARIEPGTTFGFLNMLDNGVGADCADIA